MSFNQNNSAGFSPENFSKGVLARKKGLYNLKSEDRHGSVGVDNKKDYSLKNWSEY